MVYFDKPQPVDGKTIATIPKAFRGNWTSEKINLEINKTSIIQKSYEIVKIPQTEIDTSNNYIRKDNFIYKFEDDHLAYKADFFIENDTIVIKNPEEFNSYSLGNNGILKKVGKYYLLNIKEDNGMWQVVLVEKNGNNDILFKLLNNDKLVETVAKEQLAELISPTLNYESEDSRDYYYTGNLTMEDISNLINDGAFSDTLIHLSSSDWPLTT